MANDLSNNPLIIDTPGAGDVLAASAPITVQSIRWDPGAAGAQGDQCIVTDSAGRQVFAYTIRTGTLVGDWQEYPQGLRMKGLKVPTLARGKAYIYTA